MAASDLIVIPVGDMVLVVNDGKQKTTRGGLILPDSAAIPTLTGRIVRISDALKNPDDPMDTIPFEELDRVIYDPREAVPVDFEQAEKKHYLINIRWIYGIIRGKDGGCAPEVREEEEAGR